MKASRRFVVKSLAFASLGSIVASQTGFSFSGSEQKVWLLGHRLLAKPYVNQLGKSEFEQYKIKEVTQRGLKVYEPCLEVNAWRDIVNSIPVESGKKQPLLVLAGCLKPEAILQDSYSRFDEIWIDRPLNLTREQKLEISERYGVKISLVQIDREEVHVQSII